MSDWKYDLDEVGPDAPDEQSIEPGSPSFENAAFVILGALTTVFFFAQLALSVVSP